MNEDNNAAAFTSRRHAANVLRYEEFPAGTRITWHIRTQGMSDMPYWFRWSVDDEKFNAENALECVAHPEDQGLLVSVTKPKRQSSWLRRMAGYLNRDGYITGITPDNREDK